MFKEISCEISVKRLNDLFAHPDPDFNMYTSVIKHITGIDEKKLDSDILKFKIEKDGVGGYYVYCNDKMLASDMDNIFVLWTAIIRLCS